MFACRRLLVFQPSNSYLLSTLPLASAVIAFGASRAIPLAETLHSAVICRQKKDPEIRYIPFRFPFSSWVEIGNEELNQNYPIFLIMTSKRRDRPARLTENVRKRILGSDALFITCTVSYVWIFLRFIYHFAPFLVWAWLFARLISLRNSD